MKTLKSKLLAALLLTLLLPASFSSADDTLWEEVYTKDGVKVSRRTVPGSDLFAFRGEGDINAPIEKVLAVLRDTARSKEWVDRVKEIRHVRQLNEWERLDYYQLALPWPLKDRDFLYIARLEMNAAAKTIVFSARSVVDPEIPPVNDLVRGEVFDTSLRLTPIDGGRRTHAIGEAHTDPKGSVPVWIVNLVQKSWPYNTFVNVRRQVAKPDIQDDPMKDEIIKAMY